MTNDPASDAGAPEDPLETLRRIPTLPLAERRPVLERLLQNPSIGVRQRALAMGAVLLPEDQLVGYLRQEGDDVLRNAGLEILKARGPRSLPLAIQLLADEDPDVVLQAVLVLDHLRDPRSLEPLRAVLDHPDINVVQAALLALGRLGEARAFDDLARFLDGDPWLQMATIRALGHLRSPRAIPRLERLLSDLLLGPLAAESLAQIGGSRALKVLVKHWVDLREEIESESFLSQLAVAATTRKKLPPIPEAARASIAAELDSPQEAVRTSAARCLLAFGPGPGDEAALDRLLEAAGESSHLPDCLEFRADLVEKLVARGGPARLWGLRLAVKSRAHIPAAVLLENLADETNRVSVELAAGLLEHCRDQGMGPHLVAAFAKMPNDLRALLGPAVRRHKSEVRGAMAAADIDPESRLALSILVQLPAARLARSLASIDVDTRVRLLPLVVSRPPLLRRLPWKEWLETFPAEHAEAAAEAARRGGHPELVTWLRARLAVDGDPEPQVIRSLGQLRDRESAPLLVALLGRTANPRIRAQALESLGQIGGAEARGALRSAAASAPTPEARVAYRALSACSTEEDSPFFRDAASHTDWAIRLSAVEALGRSRQAEDWPALVALSADPVAAVSHKAMACLAP